MSIKVLTEAWEIENKIKNMNKKELQEFMLGYLKNAESFTYDNMCAVIFHLSNIKRKIESIDKDLIILEKIKIKDKTISKEYVLKRLEEVKERIEKLFEEEN